jgi:hypothetical protein
MKLSQENSHLQKTAIFKEFIDKILSKGMCTFFNTGNKALNSLNYNIIEVQF